MEETARTQLRETTGMLALSVTSNTRTTGPQGMVAIDNPTPISDDVANAIVALPTVNRSAVQLRFQGDLSSTDGLRRRVVTVHATRGDLPPKAQLVAGRDLGPADERDASRVAVLSQAIAERLASDSSAVSLVGQTVLLRAAPVTVVGVERAAEGAARPEIRVPFATARALGDTEGGDALPTVLLEARNIEDVETLEQQINDMLAAGDTAWATHYNVGSYRARAQQLSQGILVFKLLMGALTGISLLVGGIGIMNVLLASVAERTREIGIRRAAGATRRDILAQFLSESVAISALGSLIGVLLGLAGVKLVVALIRSFANAPFIQASFSVTSIAVATLVTVAIGLIFGTYPARRAAALNPIDAIRHE
jgi:putative ABC transport system permease protein